MLAIQQLPSRPARLTPVVVDAPREIDYLCDLRCEFGDCQILSNPNVHHRSEILVSVTGQTDGNSNPAST